MRLIKLAFLSFVVFFAILTAMSLMIPSHVRISRAVNMKGRPDSIMGLVRDTGQWPRWHPAFTAHADAASVLRDNKISLQPLSQNDSMVLMRWQQEGRRPVINGWTFHQYAHTDSVTLQWFMDFRMQWYPWQKFSSLFYEGTYGKMMEQGLANLKSQVQKAP